MDILFWILVFVSLFAVSRQLIMVFHYQLEEWAYIEQNTHYLDPPWWLHVLWGTIRVTDHENITAIVLSAFGASLALWVV